MKKPKFGDNHDFPKMKFKGENMGPGHHDDQQEGGEYHVDKRVLQERRVSKLMTRASFVSFLMWLFIAISAAIGLRAARAQPDTTNSKWFMRCSIRKSIIFLVLASLLGIWKMILSKKIMHQFERFGREEKHKGNFGKKHHGGRQNGEKWHKGGKGDEGEWSFNQVKQMSKQEQNQIIQEMFEKEMSVVYGRRDSRHLSAAAPDM